MIKKTVTIIIITLIICALLGCSESDQEPVRDLPSSTASLILHSPTKSPTPTEPVRPSATHEATTEFTSIEQESIDALYALPPLKEIAARQIDMGWKDGHGLFSFIMDNEDNFSYQVFHQDGSIGKATLFLKPDNTEYSGVTRIERRTHWDDKGFNLSFYYTNDFFAENMAEGFVDADTDYIKDVVTVLILFSERDIDKQQLEHKVGKLVDVEANESQIVYENDSYKMVYENDAYKFTFSYDATNRKMLGIVGEYKYNWLANDFDIEDYEPINDDSITHKEEFEDIAKYTIQGMVEATEWKQKTVFYTIKTNIGRTITVSYHYSDDYVVEGGGLPFLCEEGKEYIFYIHLAPADRIEVDAIQYIA